MDKTKDLDGEISANSSAMDMTSMMGDGLSVRIKGRDLDKLQEIAKDISEIVGNTEGTTEVSDGFRRNHTGIPHYSG